MSINTSDTTSQPVFEDRLRAVWSSIQKSECFANSSPKDVLISLVGDYTLESPDNQKSVAVNMYHFGTVLDNVMLVFSPTDQKLTIVVDVSRERSFNCLKSLVQSGEEGQNISSLNVHIVEFESKRDLERVFAITENSGSMKIFTAMKELPLQKGRLADAMNEFLKEHSQSLSVNDGTSALSEALVIKDSKALDCVRKASSFASYIMKHVALETIEESLTEEDVEISASALSTKLQTSILTPTTVEGLENVKQYSYGISLAPPLVLSGPVENPNPLRRPIPDLISNSPLRDDVICVAFGVKYAGYVSYLARTFLFNCESTEQSNYDALMDLFDDLLQELKPGVRIGVVCETVRVNFERKYPELIPHLTPTMGFGVGLEVLEKTCNLTTKNDRILQPGMTLAVRVAFEGLTKNKGLSPYHMLIADTVVITDDGNTEPLSKIPYEKRYVAKKISMNEDLEKSSSRPLAIHERSSRSAKGIQLQAEDERNKIQAQIREQRRKEAEKSDKKSVKGPETEQDQSELARLARGAIKTYENERDLPTVRPGSMVVDRGHSALLLTGLLPNGAISVFHIATIRLVEAKTEGESILFRIHFHHLQETNIAHRIHQDKIFLKELSFRVKSQSFADSVVKEIKGVQAMIKQRDAQRKQQSEVIQQKGLILSKENTRRLRDVRCYPNPRQTVGGRGAPVGDLEAHENGIRFLLRDQQPLQVLYNNIQCILFQPADSEGRVLIHFHLKQHIQVGKKKTLDVQFYLDVTEESEAVGAKRFRTEAEEEMEEEREKERITKVNTEFLHYAKKLENVTLMKVEVPLKSFTFNGTHDKAMVRFRASDRTLFSVTEPPPFVQNMEQVEIVVFERVTSLKTDFDLTFVLKDYTTKHLTTVQYKMIDRIKDWFNAASVKYYELDVNLQWRTVLKEIKADEEWDPWGPNGWESILGESEENDESDENSSASDSDESDSEFVLSSEEVSDSDSSDEELDSDFVDESSGSAGSNSDDEEALDWDELERRAEAEDRKRGLDSGSDDDKRKKSSGHKHKKRSHSSSESESSSASSDSTPKKNKNKKKKHKK